jgi:hypothetical protein
MPDRKAFLLRMDAALYRELEGWAQQELRSVNGQIEYLLREALRRRRGEPPSPSAPADVPASSLPGASSPGSSSPDA